MAQRTNRNLRDRSAGPRDSRRRARRHRRAPHDPRAQPIAVGGRLGREALPGRALSAASVAAGPASTGSTWRILDFSRHRDHDRKCGRRGLNDGPYGRATGTNGERVGVVMRRRFALAALALCVAGLPAIGVGLGAQLAVAAGGTRQISASGTGQLVAPSFGSGAVEFPEFAEQESEEEPTPGVGPDVDRANSGGTGNGGSVISAKKAKSNPELIRELRRAEPPPAASRQRRQPVLRRAARPGPVRRATAS